MVFFRTELAHGASGRLAGASVSKAKWLVFHVSTSGSLPLGLRDDRGEQAHGAGHNRRRHAGAGQRAAAALDAAPHHVLAECHHVWLHTPQAGHDLGVWTLQTTQSHCCMHCVHAIS